MHKTHFSKWFIERVAFFILVFRFQKVQCSEVVAKEVFVFPQIAIAIGVLTSNRG